MAVLGIFGALTTYFINLPTQDATFKNSASLLTFLLFIITGLSLIKKFPKKSDNLLNIFGILFFFLIIIVSVYVTDYYNLVPLIIGIVSLLGPLYFSYILGKGVSKLTGKRDHIMILIISLILFCRILFYIIYMQMQNESNLFVYGLLTGIFLYIFYPSVQYLFPKISKFFKKYFLEK